MSSVHENQGMRRSLRYACVMEARLPESEARVFEPALLVKVADISTGGIGLHCSERFDAGAVLNIKLYNRQQESLPPRRARVVHATEQSNGTWVLGAEFLESIIERELQFLLK